MKVIVENASVVFERIKDDQFKVTLNNMQQPDHNDLIELKNGTSITVHLPAIIQESELLFKGRTPEKENAKGH